MSFHYEQGYRGPGGGNSFPSQGPTGGPYGAGIPPGDQYGGSAPPSAPPAPPGYAPYGGSTPLPGGQYAGGPAPGGPYTGYGQPQGMPYGQQPPVLDNVPPGVNPEAYQWFQSVDTDHSGFITLKELRQALVNSNWSAFNDETCLMMINMFDKTKSGRMDIFGFSELWVYMQQWRALFQQFDHDCSGCISGNELHQALSQMGYNLSPEFTQSLAAQHSPRGSMQLDRFIQVCTQLQSMTQAFREKDAAMAGNVRMSYEDFLTSAVTRLEVSLAAQIESPALGLSAVMWPVLWTAMRTYAPYVTFPVALVVGAVGYHLEWFIRGTPTPKLKEEKGILELREDRRLEELVGQDSTQVTSLKERLEFTPRAVLERNRSEKS
ncbi:hypothetical protein AGOR_G00038480 [Albula goreensis]|uniref:Peflin n=1 Tax=Albula goreensis TaxID=1534307 RepID=A0A8T3E5C7_9TELE|nr:hypothetical protein AGOR_G00038480 [Albula goreensis]